MKGKVRGMEIAAMIIAGLAVIVSGMSVYWTIKTAYYSKQIRKHREVTERIRRAEAESSKSDTYHPLDSSNE